MLETWLFAASLLLLISGLDAQGCQFVRYANTNIYGGNLTTDTSLAACQATCQARPGCQGIDWEPGTSRCFLLGKQTDKNYNVQGVDHYDLVCNGCSWTPYPNTLIYGGTANSANTLDACQTACIATSGCISIDWALSNAVGNQCFLLQKKTDKVSNAQGVTHYDYDCPNTGCQYVRFPNTNIYGGNLTTDTSLAACQATCRVRPGCQGIDWDIGTSRCYLLWKQTDKNYNVQSVDHYDLVCNVPSSCNFVRYDNTNIYGGMVNPAASELACQDACRAKPGCQGIDWSPNSPVGQQCFLHNKTTDKNYNINGVTHYDYICGGSSSTAMIGISSTTAGPPGTCYWSAFSNNQILGGNQTAADTVDACKQACLYRYGCASIDFTPNNPSGSKCYLLATTNGRMPSQSGTTHYDYVCPNNTCWQKYPNTLIYGGQLNSATSLADCWKACMDRGKSACMSVDWAYTNSVGSQCFLLNTQLGKTANQAGVDHYDLTC